MSLTFPPRLSLAALPTPLQRLTRFPLPAGSPRVWIKRDDLTGCLGTGNKVRKLEFVLAEAIRQGCDTIITCGGLQSNHCRATALYCAQLGLACELVLRGEPEDVPNGNLFLDHLLGARVHAYPAAVYARRQAELLAEAAEACRQRGGRPWVVPTGASDGIGAWGYVQAARELAEDFAREGIQPSLLVCATGSGGTQAGLTAGSALYLDSLPVLGIAVCDDRQYFLDKVRADLRDWRLRFSLALDVDSWPIHVQDEFIGPGYGRAGPEVHACIRALAAAEGIVLDPVYSGKAFHGLMQLLAAGEYRGAGDVVFIHTGGLFALFDQRAEALGLSA